MTSRFLIEVRKIVHSIDTIDLSDNDITSLSKKYHKLNEKINNAILRNPETGKQFLIANLLEFERENGHVQTILKVKLEKLQDIGFGPYDAKWHYLKEVLNCWDDAMETLLKTYNTYFSKRETSTELNNQTLNSLSNSNTNEPVNNTDKEQKETKTIDAKMFVAICKELKLFHHTDGKTNNKERVDFLKSELSKNSLFQNIEIKQAWNFVTIERYIKEFSKNKNDYFVKNEEKIYNLLQFIKSD